MYSQNVRVKMGDDSLYNYIVGVCDENRKRKARKRNEKIMRKRNIRYSDIKWLEEVSKGETEKS